MQILENRKHLIPDARDINPLCHLQTQNHLFLVYLPQMGRQYIQYQILVVLAQEPSAKLILLLTNIAGGGIAVAATHAPLAFTSVQPLALAAAGVA